MTLQRGRRDERRRGPAGRPRPAVAALLGLLARPPPRPPRGPLRRRRRSPRHDPRRTAPGDRRARLVQGRSRSTRSPPSRRASCGSRCSCRRPSRPPLIALVVAVVGWAVQAFAGWYLRDDDRYGIFAATVSLFTAAMLLVVQSADLVLTLVGWEVMGWCSYLLIGHWSRKESARRAALKAFLVTRLADVGFVLGVVILAAGAGSTAYPQVLQAWARAGLPGRRALRRAERAPCGRRPWCCSSSGSSASPAWSRSTTGSPTRWRAPPRPPPSSTRRRWSPRARSSSRSSSTSSRPVTVPAGCWR